MHITRAAPLCVPPVVDFTLWGAGAAAGGGRRAGAAAAARGADRYLLTSRLRPHHTLRYIEGSGHETPSTVVFKSYL